MAWKQSLVHGFTLNMFSRKKKVQIFTHAERQVSSLTCWFMQYQAEGKDAGSLLFRVEPFARDCEFNLLVFREKQHRCYQALMGVLGMFEDLFGHLAPIEILQVNSDLHFGMRKVHSMSDNK
ncbi:hypothetical protein CDAR_591411 [Caerostris darwini]|uniref:Uncharacterized protein n=1 Tax=Caerostris darwini TaxID=1538125 RepID=A0AAV4QXJ2_9ARAC|nr:hypothetical protein CDAR_591411 [Caerostris darwini]